jgi:hypothetical protein
MTTETIEDIAANHFFWFNEALKACADMMATSFDLETDRFDKARQRFELSVERANKEKERLQRFWYEKH